jgi:hypothetical protein
MALRQRLVKLVRELIAYPDFKRAREIHRLTCRVEFLEIDLETYRVAYQTATDEITALKKAIKDANAQTQADNLLSHANR